MYGCLVCSDQSQLATQPAAFRPLRAPNHMPYPGSNRCPESVRGSQHDGAEMRRRRARPTRGADTPGGAGEATPETIDAYACKYGNGPIQARPDMAPLLVMVQSIGALCSCVMPMMLTCINQRVESNLGLHSPEQIRRLGILGAYEFTMYLHEHASM